MANPAVGRWRWASIPATMALAIIFVLAVQAVVGRPGSEGLAPRDPQSVAMDASAHADAGQVSEVGCGVVPQLEDRAEPDPVELRRGPGGPIPPAIGPLDRVVPIDQLRSQLPLVAPVNMGGHPAQAAVRKDLNIGGDERIEWVVEVFYGSRPPLADETLHQYIDSGGVYFLQHQSVGRDAEEALRQLADQGRDPLPPTVDIGPYTAVAVHADPIIRNDLRPWHLYWSDGESDFSLQGNVPIDQLVAMARALYC